MAGNLSESRQYKIVADGYAPERSAEAIEINGVYTHRSGTEQAETTLRKNELVVIYKEGNPDLENPYNDQSAELEGVKIGVYEGQPIGEAPYLGLSMTEVGQCIKDFLTTNTLILDANLIADPNFSQTWIFNDSVGTTNMDKTFNIKGIYEGAEFSTIHLGLDLGTGEGYNYIEIDGRQIHDVGIWFGSKEITFTEDFVTVEDGAELKEWLRINATLK